MRRTESIVLRAVEAFVVRHVLADELLVVQSRQAVCAFTNDYRGVSLAAKGFFAFYFQRLISKIFSLILSGLCLAILDELDESHPLRIELLLGQIFLINFFVLDCIVDLFSNDDSVAVDPICFALIVPVCHDQVRMGQSFHFADFIARLVLILHQAYRLAMTFCLLQPQLLTSLVQLFFLSLAGRWLREVLTEFVGAQVILVDDRELLVAHEGVVLIDSCLFSDRYSCVTLLE